MQHNGVINTFSLKGGSALLRPDERRNQYLRVFLLALGTSALVFLPSVIYYGGFFYFSGDFNVQQIPFYQMAWRSVHEGNIFWTWTTDLGTNFLSSYSFYIVGSPFFWLALLFPYEWLPFMMAPLLILKTACAALTSYMYIKRFVSNQNFAVIGALLYAFSGWATYNIFFNHFHEALVFFPLMLVGLEKLVLEGKKGRFAAAVGINALVNYFFFAGEVVFVILYFFIRFSDRGWRMTFKRFLSVAFEALFGTLAACVLLVPSVIMVLNNPRTTSYATGFNMLFYDRVQRYGYILQSLFFPPELPARLNFFPDSGSRWSSLAAWLPFVSMSGVISFVYARKKHWIKRLLLTCLGMALVPVLNSLFIMLNSSYYARWFYMPVLIMALATAKALSEPGVDLRRGMRWTLVCTLIFTFAIGLLPQKDGDTLKLGLYANAERFWGYVIIALYCCLMFFLVWKSYRQKSGQYAKLLTVGICVTSVIYGVFFLLSGTTGKDEADFMSATYSSSAEDMGLDTSTFWRMDVDGDTMDNIGMLWNIPNIQCFQSTINPSIMEFYPTVGVTRDVGSRPDQEQYALRGLLSVKYLFIAEKDVNKEEDPVECTMPGFTYYDTQNEFCIYENQYFVPMGFGYDYYLTQEQYDALSESQRCRAVLKCVVLSDEQAAKYADVLRPVEDVNELSLTTATYEADCDDRRAQSCYSFEEDTNGFTAHSNLETDELMFFSVPYEDNAWSATVNGAPVDVEKVTVGFIAVRVPAGECEIRVNYKTPGLALGAAVSCVSILVLVGYVAVNFWIDRKYHGGKPVPAKVSCNPAEDWMAYAQPAPYEQSPVSTDENRAEPVSAPETTEGSPADGSLTTGPGASAAEADSQPGTATSDAVVPGDAAPSLEDNPQKDPGNTPEQKG